MERRPRLDDVAADVGLSPATVSLVLRNIPGPSQATRERVLEAAGRLGYRVNQAASLLARRRAHLLGVMLDVRNSFHAELVVNLHEAAEEVGYDLVLSTVTHSRSEQQAIETLVDFRCEALILLGPGLSVAELSALGRQVPLVVIGRRVSAPGVDVVRSADDDGVGQAVAHLADLGHRHIAFVGGAAGTIAADRRKGFEKAMHRLGMAQLARIVPGDFTEEAGTRAALSLLAGPQRPTAVLTVNDRSAVGFLHALAQARIDVPREFSVVGYDDSPAAQIATVQLTTVSQNAGEQARRAVAAAVQRLDGGRARRREVVLSPHLVIRSTTAAPRRPAGVVRPPA